jgi:cell division protein FtsB
MSQPTPHTLRKKLKRRRLIMAILILVPLLGFVLFSKRGIIARVGLEMEKQTMQAEIMQVRKQQDSLRAVIEQLQSDTALIEKLAREKYGMVRPGETVYRIEQE